MAASPAKESPPAVPAASEKPRFRPIYNMDSSTGTILIYRQSESHASQAMATPADVYSNHKIDYRERVAAIEPLSDYWAAFIRNHSDTYVQEHMAESLEAQLLGEMPPLARTLVYLRALNVKALVDDTSYESLARKALMSSFELPHIKQILAGVGEEHRALLGVYVYCLHELAAEMTASTVAGARRTMELLTQIPGITNPEVLVLLFKFTALTSRVSTEEFCYKGSRAVEDLQPECFLHITKQGINLAEVLAKALDGLQDNTDFLLLDFLVFEGVDFLLRVFCGLFTDKLLGLNGSDLHAHLLGDFLSVTRDDIRRATEIEIPLIKYENEFHLMMANSISGTDNELINLQETKHELETKLHELQGKMDSLRKTHEEIHGQNQQYSANLALAIAERESLNARKNALAEKYAQLTMQENLANTIKANEDISRMNTELETQIADVKKKIVKLTGKVAA